MTTLPVSQRLARTRMLLDDLISHVESERNRANSLAPPRRLNTSAVFRAPAAIYPALPVELIDNVCQRLAMRDLTALVRTNSALYAVGMRLLYRTLSADLPPPRLLKCMCALDRSADLALLVRTFEVNLINQIPTKNFYLLLARVLRKMTFLTTLALELPKRHSPSWILPMPGPGSEARQRFRLHSFTTSMHCKLPLALFLDSQPEITELTLRGINQDSSNPLFPFISSLFSTLGDNPFADAASSSSPVDPDAFTLLPASLPKLSHFNAIHAGPTVIRNIITARPVTHISIPLFPPHTMATLTALSLTSKPLSRLSVMSFDPAAPQFLVPELASRFPDLEALHIVVLMAEVSGKLLIEWGVFLIHFRRLRYITFMAALGGEDEEEREEIDERKIAKAWHASCPTLKTIILPQGKVWFEGSHEDDGAMDEGGNWKCLNWDDDAAARQ